MERRRPQMRNSTGEEEWQKGIHRAKRSRFVYLPSKSSNSEFAIFYPEPLQIPSSKYHQTGNCSIQTSGGCSVENISTSPDNYSFDPEPDGMNPCPDKNDEEQSKKESNLRDVTLTVERHNHEQKVPLVSLTSGLNLSAIIGHPIEVDVLDDNNKFHDDGIKMLWPMWKTSRRTHVCYVQQTLHPQPQMTKKPLKKPQIMSIDMGNIEINKTDDDDDDDDVPARVTCIPIKIVFSRLLVSVGS